MALIERVETGTGKANGLVWDQIQPGQVITVDVSKRLHEMICELCDYEATGLDPREVEQLINESKSIQEAAEWK